MRRSPPPGPHGDRRAVVWRPVADRTDRDIWGRRLNQAPRPGCRARTCARDGVSRRGALPPRAISRDTVLTSSTLIIRHLSRGQRPFPPAPSTLCVSDLAREQERTERVRIASPHLTHARRLQSACVSSPSVDRVRFGVSPGPHYRDGGRSRSVWCTRHVRRWPRESAAVRSRRGSSRAI